MCGLKERTIQRKLLVVADLTLQLAVRKACAPELTKKETIALHGGGVEEANQVRVMFPECFHCGKVNHSSDFAIPSAMAAKRSVTLLKNVTVKQLVNGSDWPMFTVSYSRAKCKEFIVPVTIDGKTVDMEPDTGASVTIIPKSMWTDVLASKTVECTDIKLRSYSGHKISVVGKAKVQVVYRDQKAALPVVITGNDGPALMGRDWLSVLKMDWEQVKQKVIDAKSTWMEVTSAGSTITALRHLFAMH